MSKVKVSLASGSIFEKPVITCFKGNNANYIVLDNEANGQMGYPIICISRLNNNVLEKITDQGEWGAVKDNLKTIISGTSPVYVNVPDGLTAQDDFYTQLTLPVASFDMLKNSYAPAPETPEVPPAPVVPEPPIEAPQEMTAPMPETVQPAISDPSVISEPTIIGPTMAPQPEQVMTAPVITPLPGAPEMPTPMPSPLPVTSPMEEPVVTPLAAQDSTSTPAMPALGNDIQALKDSFMKSCENMFDALIKKFENK